MKVSLALLAPLLLTGCFTVKPVTETPETRRSRQARWETARATGLTYRAERLSARSESAGVSAASSAASFGQQNATAGGVGVTAGNAAVFETYENDDLQRLMKYSLEDAGLIGSFSESAPVEIEGVVYKTGVTTSGWLVLRNFLTYISLTFYIGMPITGTNEAEIQIRVRENGRLVAKSTGTAQARWRSHFYPLELCRQESTRLAAKKAVILAVQNLQSQEPSP